MEIKVQCDCGQKYKFDAEPVNGQMPYAINCPICGIDGTQKANALIQQTLAVSAQPHILPPPPITPSTPEGTGKLKLSFSPEAHAPAPRPEPMGLAPAPISGGGGKVELDYAGKPKLRKSSFGMGLLGGFCGALLGSIIYYLIFKTTGYRISFMAIGVGGLAGWWAELFGKGEGSKELAGITAVLTVALVIGAQYLVALGVWHDILGADFGKAAYDVDLKRAQLFAKAAPNGSDAEIKTFLAKEQVEDNAKPDPSSISDEDVKQFRDTELPTLHDLAAGTLTREQYYSKKGIDAQKEAKKNVEEDTTFKEVFMLLLLTKSNIFSLVAAAVLAFRLSANA